MTTSIYDLIAFHARLRPGALAVIGREEAVRYGELLRDIDTLAALLFERGVTGWSLAGIDLGTTYLHLVAMLALDRLNVPSLSVTSQFRTTRAWLSRQGSRAGTISENPPGGHAGLWIVIEPDWRVQPASAAYRAYVKTLSSPLRAIVQLGLSSGTTGSPKAVPMTRIMQLTKLQEDSRVQGVSNRTRVLVFSFLSLSTRFIATLAAGGTIVIAGDWDDDIADIIDRFSVTHMAVTPVLVDHLLGITRRTGARYPSLQYLLVGAGRLPYRTAREALALLTPHIYVAYAATEVGWISCAHMSVVGQQPDAVGYLVPGCELEVVDDDGRPLPDGTAGSVRIRKAAMPRGYHRDPEATARHFRDGWFCPNEVAVLEPTGMVRFLGRTDEVISSRGLKIGPAMIEDVFRSQPGVIDVAAFAAPAMSGGDQPWVALVCEPGTDAHNLMRTGLRELGLYAPVKHLSLDTLPRTETGKVLRRALRDMVVRQRADRQETGE